MQKVGDRRYLEDWSKDVNEIAQRYIRWINERLNDKDNPIKAEFTKFVHGLQHNINESITQDSAVEMLAQHLITKPVFEALFDEYSFVNNNPVSQAMETIVNELQKAGFEKEQEKLAPFYESVKLRASGVDNAEGKQKIIITLYDKFFSTGFKSTTERLGIVFTPIEVVDFIVKSVDDVLNKHFRKSLASEGVHILDPFTGTGTFIVRTLTYLKEKMDAGEITLADIIRKYTQELHANEIVLLSYYIAAINIEATFEEIKGDEQGYVPFEGIVLTDTFESTEYEDTLDDTYFDTNDKRLKRQQEVLITAIIGNPPYSAKQTSVNDNNANLKYPILDQRLADTYVANSTATNKNNLYDSYIRALRWSSDRLRKNGIIGFVTGAGFIDGNTADGLRKSLHDEFNYLYIFNLRGDQRTQGEASRKEGGKIFGSGSRTPIAISILVKDGSDKHDIFYHDIGDYLSREQKLELLKDFSSIKGINWREITPDKNNDWINQRNEIYMSYPAVSDEDNSIFMERGIGYSSSRDPWVVSFSKENAKINSERLTNSFNEQVDKVSDESDLEMDLTKINWSDDLLKRWSKKEKINFNESDCRIIQYRPFTKKWVNNLRPLIKRPSFWNKAFGNDKKQPNLFLNFGSGIRSSSLITQDISDYQLLFNTKSIPYKTFDENSLLDSEVINIRDTWLSYFDTNEDVLYYVYGVLHSTEYRQKYANDLQKALPRIPLLKNKEIYIEIGRKLADLHLNYENQPSWDGVEVKISGTEQNYRVKKMKHPKKGVLDTIIFNKNITIKNIPEQAYEYVVNGRPAIEWIIDQYQVKTDMKSGITDDPNEFSDDPKYILNLLMSVITVSMKTIELVGQLPKFEVVDDSQTLRDEFYPLGKDDDLPMVAEKSDVYK